MKVKDVMVSIVRVDVSATVTEIAQLMSFKMIGSVLVEKNGSAVGVMTERDLLRKIVAKGVDPNTASVKDIMSSPIITINSDEDVSIASKMMEEKNIRRLIVKEGEKIIGKITTSAISKNLRYMLGTKVIGNHESEHVRPEIHEFSK